MYFNLLIYKEKERAGHKPGSVVDNHSSGTAVADCLKQPTREPVQARCGQARMLPYLVLLQAGFTVPRSVATRAVRSYRTISPLPTPKCRRYIFCGTFHGFTPSRRYLAPCLTEPGLSSRDLLISGDCLADSYFLFPAFYGAFSFPHSAGHPLSRMR